MSDAEKRMREIYAQELDRDGEGMAAFLWRESGPAHPDSPNGRIICAMLAAEAAAIERAAVVADDREQQLRAMAADHKERGLYATYPTIDNKADLAANLATAIRSLKEGASHVG